MPDNSGKSSFWTSLPGIITAIASLVGVLVAAGVIKAAVNNAPDVVSTKQATEGVGESGGGGGRSTDDMPPSQPLDASVASGVSGVVVIWSPSSDNLGVTEYKVYRDGDTEQYAIYTVDAKIEQPVDGRYQRNDTNVSPNETHEYYVAAFDAAGNRSITPPMQITYEPGSGGPGA